MERFSAVWQWDDSAGGTGDYVDLTVNCYSDTNFTFLNDADDFIYLGFNRRWIGIYSDIATSGNYTGISFTYFNGTSWKPLSLIDSYTFSNSRYIRWVLPLDWASWNFTAESPHSKDPIDTNERYWVRVTASAITTPAVIDKLRCLPYVQYATSTDVSDFLQLKTTFNSSTKPTDLAVENLLRNAEARIDYRTHKSWRFNPVSEEASAVLVDYNRYGLFPRYRNLVKVYGISLWNGGSWDLLVEGRENDYFVNKDLGMIYFTRLFLLPAAYGMTGRYFHYGFGEFKNSIKLDYAYGRDSEIDPEFFVVRDVAMKTAAKDLLKNHDYSSFVVSGTDKVPLSDKVARLEGDRG
jgi:hypothetical protein